LGDEPELLNRRFGRPIVYSGKDRVALGRRAIQDGAKVLILDDGFQYRRLHRDFELLVVDGAEPFGFGAFLPRGLLRDPISRLREADALFVKNAQLCAEFRCLKIQMQPKVKRIVDLRGIPTKLFSDVKVGVFCAIANPKRFFSTVESLGAIEVERWILPDHERADLQMLERFAQRCRAKGAKAILCTEKDAVKLPPQLKLSLPLYYLEMELEFVTGLSEWQKLIEKISLSINNLHQSSSRK
jgi:tetraacyldisaccharide 4'-kinase